LGQDLSGTAKKLGRGRQASWEGERYVGWEWTEKIGSQRETRAGVWRTGG